MWRSRFCPSRVDFFIWRKMKTFTEWVKLHEAASRWPRMYQGQKITFNDGNGEKIGIVAWDHAYKYHFAVDVNGKRMMVNQDDIIAIDGKPGVKMPKESQLVISRIIDTLNDQNSHAQIPQMIDKLVGRFIDKKGDAIDRDIKNYFDYDDLYKLRSVLASFGFDTEAKKVYNLEVPFIYRSN